MTHDLRRMTGAVMAAAAMATVPMAGVIVFTPAISWACLPGETAGPAALCAVLSARQGARCADGFVRSHSDPAPNGVNPPINDY